MKLSTVLVCAALTIASNSYGQDQPFGAPITLDELNRRNVVGNLGLPLGTAVEIEAEVVSGRSLRRKGYDSLYLLKVLNVDGKDLNASPLMRFSLPGFVDVELRNHTFALYEMKRGTKAKSLNSTQIAELEKGYVGKKVRLVVYEVGSFHGIPDQLPKDVPVWADFGFHFSTSLTVLNERDAESKRQSHALSLCVWTIVRPAAFTDGEKTEQYQHGFTAQAEGLTLKISRADVADFMIRQLRSLDYLRKTPALSY